MSPRAVAVAGLATTLSRYGTFIPIMSGSPRCRLLISNSAVGVATLRAQSCSLLLDEMRDGLRDSSYFAADL
jgi:hypothetical protein